MGQYYKAYIEDYNGHKVFNPHNAIYMTMYGHEFDRYDEMAFSCMSGLKLMEHSWFKNDFVNGVVEQLAIQMRHVAWVGDYADETTDFNEEYTEEVYDAVWGENSEDSPFETMFMTLGTYEEGFIINYTKNEYVDLAKYYKLAKAKPSWSKYEWCVHPLPLLTVIGNGRGGGDYHGTNMKRVGSWAMDVIGYSRYWNPSYMQDISDIVFIEGQEAE